MLKIRKIVYVVFCAITLSFLISGCAEAPDEVKKEIAEIQQAKEEQRELEKSLTFIHPFELQRDAQEHLSIDDGVFRFEGNVIVPECEDVYLLELGVNDEMFENLDKNMPLIMEYVGAKDKDWQNYITAENGVNGNAESAADTIKTFNDGGYCFLKVEDTIVEINQSGMLNINRKSGDEKHPYFLNVDGNIAETYSFINNREKSLNEEIELNGEKVTLGEINETFEESIELINSCSPDLNLILHDARIIEDNATNETMVVFRALNSYEGVCFDPNYIIPQDSEATGGKSFVGYEMNQQIHEVSDECNIALRETSYIVSGTKKKYNNVIDFDSALRIVEGTVPQDKITTIESAEFMYQIYYEGEEGQAWNYVYEKPPTFFATPVWKFVEQDRPSEMKATVYYVDAITGKIYSFYKACTP